MTATRQGPPVQFRDRHIEGHLDTRASRGLNRNAVAARDLDRYYDLLDRCLRRLQFSEDDLALMTRALDGVAFMDTLAPQLLAEEVVESGLPLPVDLLDRLRNLHPADRLALTDAIERRRRGQCA